MAERRILAVIPVRSGSKRFPGKNMAKWNDGKDLTGYAVHKCMQSCEFDGILVLGDEGISTAKWPMQQASYAERPDRLVQDGSDIGDSLRWADEAGMFDGYTDIALIQATSPLFGEYDVTESVKAYKCCDLLNLVSLNPYTLHEDGGIYLISLDLLRASKYSLLTERLYLWAYDKRAIHGESIDINTPEDYYIACAIRDKRVI